MQIAPLAAAVLWCASRALAADTPATPRAPDARPVVNDSKNEPQPAANPNLPAP